MTETHYWTDICGCCDYEHDGPEEDCLECARLNCDYCQFENPCPEHLSETKD